MRGLRLVCYAVVLTGLLLSGRPGFAEDTIKIAYTDPFSGPFASGGDEFLKVFQFIFARKNAMGGVLGKKLELVPFDDKLQPSEALIALKKVSAEPSFHFPLATPPLGRALLTNCREHEPTVSVQVLVAGSRIT